MQIQWQEDEFAPDTILRSDDYFYQVVTRSDRRYETWVGAVPLCSADGGPLIHDNRDTAINCCERIAGGELTLETSCSAGAPARVFVARSTNGHR